MDAEYRCQEILPLFRSDAQETLKGLDFYLKTLESFIDRERSNEISELKRHADQLPPDKQGEFWAWHYPVHWDEIFASQLRSSFVVTLVSLAESHVGMITEQIAEIAETPLRPRDLRGGILERHRKYLEALAKFSKPGESSWNSVFAIRDIRNCIVHANSRIWETQNQVRIRSLVNSLPGLSASHDILELSPELPVYAFKEIQSFIMSLYDEAAELCERVEF